MKNLFFSVPTTSNAAWKKIILGFNPNNPNKVCFCRIKIEKYSNTCNKNENAKPPIGGEALNF